jgi:hypothetical protein
LHVNLSLPDPDGNSLVAQVTGVSLPVSPPAINLKLAEGEHSFYFYYWTHRIPQGGDIWYAGGQMLDTHVRMRGWIRRDARVHWGGRVDEHIVMTIYGCVPMAACVHR